MRVRFTAAQLDLIASIGQQRQRAKDRRRIADGKLRDDAGADIHTIGFAAEYALCIYLGVQPDMHIGPRGHKGRSVRYADKYLNTHYNSYPGGDLRYFPGDVPAVDAMVLVGGALPELELVGWVAKDAFDRSAVLQTLPNRGERLLFYRSALRKIDSLPAWLGIEPEAQPAPPAIEQAQLW